MRPYRFDGLVQGRLLQLQLALFILVKVIPTLKVTQQDTELDASTKYRSVNQWINGVYRVRQEH